MTVQTERTSVSGPVPSGGASRHSPVRRVLDESPVLVVLFLMVLVTQVGAKPLDNGDTWFHLRLGHEFWGSWSLWHPGAPTKFATSPWVPTQWSTEMLSAKMEDWFGLPGVAWMYGVLYLGFLLAVYVACRRLAGPFAASVAAGGAVFAASTTLSARPQVVSLVLLAVTVSAWLQTQRDGRPRWWLVPLTWVWATAHGLWTCGLLLGVVCWLGLVIDRRVRGRAAALLLLVPVLSGLSALVTPLGPKLVLSQLAVSERTSLIAEWGATSFRTVPALAFAVMAACLLLLWLRGDRVPWMFVLMLGLVCGWAMLVTRLVPLAGVVIAPLLAKALSDRWGAQRRDRLTTVGRVERLLVGAGALACVTGLAFAVPSTAAHAAGVPTAFTPRLAALSPGSTVLVEDSSGAWMEWRFPGLQPVIDGMFDAYSPAYMGRFQTFTQAAPGWRRFAVGSGARVAIMIRDSPAATALREELHWRPVQRDREWVYLVAPEVAG